MRFELSTEEARFVREQLARRLEELDHELVHTEKRELQRALHADVRRLSTITRRLARTLEGLEEGAAVG